jgi:hypothetical protein
MGYQLPGVQSGIGYNSLALQSRHQLNLVAARFGPGIATRRGRSAPDVRLNYLPVTVFVLR